MKVYLPLLVLFAGLLAPIAPAQAASPTATATPVPNVFLYSAKFVCGLQSVQSSQFTPPAEPPVKPGNYATTINVHNFHPLLACIAKKVVISHPESEDVNGEISPFRRFELGPDGAVEIDCSDVASFFPNVKLGPFIEGFVEIQSRFQLNVTGVYTSQTCVASPTTGAGCASLGQLGIAVSPAQGFIAAKTSTVCP
jgi:hypothetical protein